MVRTKYMQELMIATYPMVAIEAVKNGFEGSWQRLIAARLLMDYKKGVSEAEVIIYSVGGLSLEKRMKAAHLITSSKIQRS